MANSHQHFIGFLQDSSLYLQTSIMDISLAKVNWALQATKTQAAWNVMFEALSRSQQLHSFHYQKLNFLRDNNISWATWRCHCTWKYRNTAWVHLIKAQTGGREIGCKCTVYIQTRRSADSKTRQRELLLWSYYLFLPQLLWAIPYEKPNIGKWDWVRTYEEVSIQLKKNSALP